MPGNAKSDTKLGFFFAVGALAAVVLIGIVIGFTGLPGRS